MIVKIRLKQGPRVRRAAPRAVATGRQGMRPEIVVRMKMPAAEPSPVPASIQSPVLTAEPIPADSDRVTREDMAQFLSTMLSPASAMAFGMALWPLLADMGVAGRFMISDGLLSHWQVWFTLAAGLQGAAWLLTRKSSGDKNDPTAAS